MTGRWSDDPEVMVCRLEMMGSLEVRARSMMLGCRVRWVGKKVGVGGAWRVRWEHRRN